MEMTNKHQKQQKIRLKILALLLILSLSLFTLSACDSKKGVPDNYAINSVGECTYSMPYPSTTSVIHNNYDEESYLDYVTIVTRSEGTYGYCISTCDAIFQYNRASDLWTLFKVDDWTMPTYTFNSKLVGSYDVSGKDEYEKIDSCHIEIVNVTEESIQLNYDISADIDLAFVLTQDLHIEKSGTETLTNGEFYTSSLTDDNPSIDIWIDLPDGYTQFNFSIGGESVDAVELILEIDLNFGIKSAQIVGTAIPNNSQ